MQMKGAGGGAKNRCVLALDPSTLCGRLIWYRLVATACWGGEALDSTGELLR